MSVSNKRRGPIQQVVFGCPKLIAGLIDLQSLFNPISQVQKLINGALRTVDTIQRFFPRTLEGGVETFESPTDSEQLVDNINAGTIPGDLPLIPAGTNSFIYKHPGKFTGEMRKVVQAIIGLGQGVPYNYKFSESHGVYTTADDTKWLIEVSAARGVLTKKLSICPDDIAGTQTLDEEMSQILGYKPVGGNETFPVGAAFNAGLGNGDIIQLISATDMSSFYSRFPFFTGCGWAFNSNGSSIANTCFEIDGSNFNVTYLFQILISEVDNKPDSATLTQLEFGFAHGDRVSHFKFPDEVAGTLISFDTFRDNFGGPATVSDGPIYVYYDNDVLIICRQSGLVSQGPSTKNNANSTFGDWGDHKILIDANSFVNGVQGYNDGGTFFDDYNIDNNVLEPTPTIDGKILQPSSVKGANGIFYSMDSASIFNMFSIRLAPGAGNPGRALSGRPVDIGGTKTLVSNQTENQEVVILVPFNDRESVYVYEQINSNADSVDVSTEFRRMVISETQGARSFIQTDPIGEPPGDYYQIVSNTYTPGSVGPDGELLIIKPFLVAHGIDLPVPPVSSTFFNILNFNLELEGVDSLVLDPTTSGIFVTGDSLTLIASGGIQQQIKGDTSNQGTLSEVFRFVRVGDNPQLLVMNRDTFSNQFFCSSDVNQLDPPNFFVDGLGSYPIDQLTRGTVIGQLFAGIP